MYYEDSQSPDSRAPDSVSVSELVGSARQTLEQTFGHVLVRGEVTNFKRHSSGHCYFSLKDEEAQLRCVMWRTAADRQRVAPTDGMFVLARGKLTVYPRRGDMQFVVASLIPAGEGALQKAFLALKAKLQSEGLFNAEYKKALPRFPEVVGIATSDSGAALQDIVSVIHRRYPPTRIVLRPIRVQGTGAAGLIADALGAFNALAPTHADRPDVIIVGRGGGSVEDLWPFNEEIVARAIFDCDIPVISAVGHETDFSISDFVADVRAATPSIAAEIAVPDRADLIVKVGRLAGRIKDRAQRKVLLGRSNVLGITNSYGFNLPADRVRHLQQRVDDGVEAMARASVRKIERERMKLENVRARLNAANPVAPLERGFTVVEKNGRRITRRTALTPGDDIRLMFYDGGRSATVTD